MSAEMALPRVTRNGQITLPASVRRAAGIEEGDLMAVTLQGDTITLVPKRLIDKSQAYFWSGLWQRAERGVSEDITQGRVRAFDDVEALITALEAGEA
jgi:AbrB family looped-hinge helix DNA binding protein